MSDCGFNIALLRNVVKLVETQLYMSQYFFSYLLTTFIDCYAVNLFFFFILFRFSKQGKRLSATNKGEYNFECHKNVGNEFKDNWKRYKGGNK